MISTFHFCKLEPFLQPVGPSAASSQLTKKVESGIQGKLYERKILALISIKCLFNKRIKNFWLMSNPKNVNKFDDVILMVEYKRKRSQLFLIQIKHKKNTDKPIPIEKLDGNDSNLSLEMYQKAFDEIKGNEEFFLNYDIATDTRIACILYNNCKITKKVENGNIDFQDIHLSEYFSFIDSSAKQENIFKIKNKTNKYSNEFLHRFYFYTNQINEDAVENTHTVVFKAKNKALEFNDLNIFATMNDINEYARRDTWFNMMRKMAVSFQGKTETSLHSLKNVSYTTITMDVYIELINRTFQLEIISAHGISQQLESFFSELYKHMRYRTIWLIDDYEAVNQPHLLGLFKEAAEKGVRIWMVARPMIREELEDTLNIFSMGLVEFSKHDQNEFYVKYLKQKNIAPDDIEKIQRRIEKTRNLFEESFIGICQQTMMVTEICLNRNETRDVQPLYIDDLYQEFINFKVVDLQDARDVYLRTLSKLALKMFFKDSALAEVFDLEECEEDIKNFRTLYKKDFFLTGFINNEVPIFSHRTYAEFLAAQWLAQAVKKQIEKKTPSNVKKI
ncbi:hypothetical protein NQ318_004052 [Aromia moschata]|uniref:Uncharacterized protein n=1 Tax=Aromia moschata TaxID=1265417 RepID=A0AAV8Z7W0_9CUCU|nr:hypothetical protein NQ318_004052 [Aromia moschata]